MNYFTKKQSFVFMLFSFLCIIAGSLLICFSHSFIDFSYNFLSEKIFHRSFDLDKWLPTIESFFLIPAFVSIVVTALFFPKFSNKAKIIVLSVFFASVLFCVLYCTAVTTKQHVNSDLASELLLAKECVHEKSFWPRTWSYSTEIRLFNTQLVTAPIFLFTNNWNIAKLLTTFFSMLILFFAVYYVLTQIKIKRFWVKYLICMLSVLPFSGMVWYVGAWGTYYIPHVVFNLIYIGTFIRLVTDTNSKHQKLLVAFFYIWAFLSGLSSIRYIMIFIFPLALIMIIDKCLEKDPNCMINNFNAFWKNTKIIKYSVIGLFISGFGYVCNNVILQPLFSFSQWNDIAFCGFGDIKISDIIHAVLEFFGYIDYIAVFTPNGIINILVYLLVFLFVMLSIYSLKNKLSYGQKILLIYFISSYLFNTFVYLHTEFIARYYYPILLLFLPCTAILLDNDKISGLKRYAVGVILSVVILSSTFATLQHQFATDENKGMHDVAGYLEKNYSFGYASFWNANVITYLTDGNVEVGNLDSTDGVISKKYDYERWLTTDRYYGDYKNNEHIFLLLSTEQYLTSKDDSSVKNGKLVYKDDYYYVFDYPSHEAFKESFDK